MKRSSATAPRARAAPRRCAGPASPWRDERGVTALEFAFVAPILLLLLTGIIQLGALLFLQTNMGNVARDTARRLAVGEISATAAPSHVKGQLLNWGGAYAVAVDMPNPSDPNDRDITVDISVPLADVALVDIVGVFQKGNLNASSTMRQE